MPLATYITPTEKVRLSKTEDFQVRAVTFPDLALLVSTRMPELIAIVTKYQEARKGEANPKDIGHLLIMVARDFPTMATEIISACIYGEERTSELMEKVALLSFPVQLDALAKIAKITVEEAGGLKNLIADLKLRMAEAGVGEASPLDQNN